MMNIFKELVNLNKMLMLNIYKIKTKYFKDLKTSILEEGMALKIKILDLMTGEEIIQETMEV